MNEIYFAPAARQDMEYIWVYTAETWNTDQANSYTATLYRDMTRLLDFPHLGTPYQTRLGDFRKLASGHHLIFYLVDDERIEVVRILHTAMDIDGSLN